MERRQAAPKFLAFSTIQGLPKDRTGPSVLG
jgi:hypothetical protein